MWNPKNKKTPTKLTERGQTCGLQRWAGGGDEGKEEVVEGGQKVPTSGYTINKFQE